ncbi:MAG TPA: hypothetical protein VJT72_19825, partial [Pseudonocardiaceae bacterium]|nr:hypothetical protein [Pseudonocardiaceae bacterium]
MTLVVRPAAPGSRTNAVLAEPRIATAERLTQPLVKRVVGEAQARAQHGEITSGRRRRRAKGPACLRDDAVLWPVPNATDVRQEGTRTPEKHECPGQKPGHSSVEILTAYSHSMQAADLRLCHTTARTSPVRTAKPSMKRPWSLRERLDEREITELIATYRNGATAASLAAAHGVSLTSVKRLLHTAGARRTTPTRQTPKAM